jgi:hypothetical protein
MDEHPGGDPEKEPKIYASCIILPVVLVLLVGLVALAMRLAG